MGNFCSMPSKNNEIPSALLFDVYHKLCAQYEDDESGMKFLIQKYSKQFISQELFAKNKENNFSLHELIPFVPLVCNEIIRKTSCQIWCKQVSPIWDSRIGMNLKMYRFRMTLQENDSQFYCGYDYRNYDPERDIYPKQPLQWVSVPSDHHYNSIPPIRITNETTGAIIGLLKPRLVQSVSDEFFMWSDENRQDYKIQSRCIGVKQNRDWHLFPMTFSHHFILSLDFLSFPITFQHMQSLMVRQKTHFTMKSGILILSVMQCVLQTCMASIICDPPRRDSMPKITFYNSLWPKSKCSLCDLFEAFQYNDLTSLMFKIRDDLHSGMKIVSLDCSSSLRVSKLTSSMESFPNLTKSSNKRCFPRHDGIEILKGVSIHLFLLCSQYNSSITLKKVIVTSNHGRIVQEYM
jgi:hypothetical protein